MYFSGILAADLPAAVHSVVPSHRLAMWLLGHICRMLEAIGLGGNRALAEGVYIVIIAALALGIGIALRYLLLFLLRRLVMVRKSNVLRLMLKERLLVKCSHVIPPLMFMGLLPFAFNRETATLVWSMRIIGVYTVCAFAVGVNAVLSFVFMRYDERVNTRNLPINGILNVAKGVVWIVVVIVSVSVLIDKSPGGILAGLGAFAAALMLIFKDSILGFVAGIQMSENDMLHVGDWITVPSTQANGIVTDVTLTTVKVQNFDNTIVTVPPYTLVSSSFQNWRGMAESGMRRIMQNFTFDYSTIHPLDDATLQRVLKLHPALKPYTDSIVAATDDDRLWLTAGDTRNPNGSLETNLGLFRLYLCVYLLNNPDISDRGRVLVQLLPTTIYGMPLQVWCWANTTDWNKYEGIQSALMEHVAAVAGDFGLALYSAGSETIDMANKVAQAPASPVGKDA